jgi:hypothetical protein
VAQYRSFKVTKDAIDKQLSHLSRERVTDPQVLDDQNLVTEMRDALRAAWEDFLARLPDPRVAHRFREAFDEAGALRGRP